jgi:hypothetical protein
LLVVVNFSAVRYPAAIPRVLWCGVLFSQVTA